MKWYNIKTKLPKERTNVLVTYVGIDGNKYANAIAYFDGNNWRWIEDGEIALVPIIAWMKLPKPAEFEEV